MFVVVSVVAGAAFFAVGVGRSLVTERHWLPNGWRCWWPVWRLHGGLWCFWALYDLMK